MGVDAAEAGDGPVRAFGIKIRPGPADGWHMDFPVPTSERRRAASVARQIARRQNLTTAHYARHQQQLSVAFWVLVVVGVALLGLVLR